MRLYVGFPAPYSKHDSDLISLFNSSKTCVLGANIDDLLMRCQKAVLMKERWREVNETWDRSPILSTSIAAFFSPVRIGLRWGIGPGVEAQTASLPRNQK